MLRQVPEGLCRDSVDRQARRTNIHLILGPGRHFTRGQRSPSVQIQAGRFVAGILGQDDGHGEAVAGEGGGGVLGEFADRDVDRVVAFEAAEGDGTVGIGDGGFVGPPLVEDQIGEGVGVGFAGPILAEHGGAGAPVAALPEAPHHEAIDGGVGEDGGEEVAGVGGLDLFVVDVDIEFGDVDGLFEFRETIEDLPEFGDGGELCAEVALHADAAERGFPIDDLADDVEVAVLVGFVEAAS